MDSKSLESSDRTSQTNTGMERHCMVTRRKRKAFESLEAPRKRPRTACKITEVEVETVTAKGTKRKSSAERQSPKRKRGCSDNADIGKPPEVPVKSVKTEGTKATSTSVQKDGSTLFTIKNREDFDAKYLELNKLGQGGFGAVYAGMRKNDFFKVAIKHIPKEDVEWQPMIFNRKRYMVPTEVLLMQKAAGRPESQGNSAIVSLLDWYDADQEVLLVMERPVPSVDLYHYLSNNKGPLEENLAKDIMKQLVEGAVKLHSEGVFHRDIKTENVLVDLSSDAPRVRFIDFGCGCFVRKTYYRLFSGTSAYVPPEFHNKGIYMAGPTTVWQLGTVLYELLDGNKVFTTSEFLAETVKFFSELRLLNVSQDCKDFLRMCLAVNPKQRATLEQMQLHPWLK